MSSRNFELIKIRLPTKEERQQSRAKASAKYIAELRDKNTGRITNQTFGKLGYQHYRDSTPIKAYKHLDHMDKKRLVNFDARFGEDMRVPYSAAWLSKRYLWS